MAESVCTRTSAQTTNTRPSAPTAPKAFAASAPREATAIQGVFRAIALALDAASLTDEPHEWSGDSDRLLRVASFLAERDASRIHDAQEAECCAYDIAALIKAARLVPGETESRQRSDLIASAEAHLVVLTDDVDCLVTGATRAPAPSKQKSVSQDTYNAEQLKNILEVVCGRTRTLQQLIMSALADDEPCMQSLNLDAACIIATSIGAMTDTAVGGSIIGGQDYWNFGPNFADTGKAVHA